MELARSEKFWKRFILCTCLTSIEGTEITLQNQTSMSMLSHSVFWHEIDAHSIFTMCSLLYTLNGSEIICDTNKNYYLSCLLGSTHFAGTS